MDMDRIVLCLLCGIAVGLLAGRIFCKCAERRKRKRLPICEVRKAPDVLYVHEKKAREADSKGDLPPLPQEQRAPVPKQSHQDSQEVCSTECFFGVRRSNPDQQRSPVSQQTASERVRKEQELQNADSEQRDWMRKVRPWIALSVLCCGGIGLLHTVQRNRRKKTPVNQ